MNKKKSLISLLIFVVAFIVGFNIMNAYYYFENIYNFSLGPMNTEYIRKVDNSNVWNTAYKYYTQTLGIDVSTYQNIYNTYSIDGYMDKILTPYYDQYGYDAVIASGLKSQIKMANVYAYEKCCEIVGDKKINKTGLLSYLKNVSIDEKNHSGTDEEQACISYAKERLELAKALLSNSTSSSMIAKNSKSSVYAWVSNGLNKKTNLRIHNKNGYLTAKNHHIDYDSKIEFVSKDVIKVVSSLSNYAVFIGDDVIMYDIEAKIENAVPQSDRKDVFITEILFTSHTVNGKYSFKEYESYSEPPEYSFELNLETGKTEIN